ncbi:hypothetical protein PVK06_027040 [Gossypium arboreum]|uniref:Uncharacterized protein n=1 Tax=Gossypium arboreum TaxID=29729 RepID=A0ABR0NZ82_GOSAR|nr:hypothetical protein PVK06_027040 [Gossypium arboreum]
MNTPNQNDKSYEWGLMNLDLVFYETTPKAALNDSKRSQCASNPLPSLQYLAIKIGKLNFQANGLLMELPRFKLGGIILYLQSFTPIKMKSSELHNKSEAGRASAQLTYIFQLYHIGQVKLASPLRETLIVDVSKTVALQQTIATAAASSDTRMELPFLCISDLCHDGARGPTCLSACQR